MYWLIWHLWTKLTEFWINTWRMLITVCNSYQLHTLERDTNSFVFVACFWLHETFIFNFCREDDTSFVHNPINALHLLKRTSKLLPKLINKKSNPKFNYNFTELYEDYQRAYYGFADIHEYLQLDLKKLIYGNITGEFNFLF